MENSKEKKKSGFWGDIRGILWAVLAALVIRALVFEPYNIPSSSMVPTLLVGDYLVVTKYNYGYSKHSFPFSFPIVPKGRLFGRTPERGDIVVFKVPSDNRTDYIKRVIENYSRVYDIVYITAILDNNTISSFKQNLRLAPVIKCATNRN